MKLVIDVETDRTIKPTKIWVVVCKDIDTGEYHVFREPHSNASAKELLRSLLARCDLLVGHNLLAFDLPAISSILQIEFPVDKTIDTLIVSRLQNYSRPAGHSIEAYGDEFGLEKIVWTDFTRWGEDLEEYCKRDVDICLKVYLKHLKYISTYVSAIELEHKFQIICNNLSTKGFSFNIKKGKELLVEVTKELLKLDIDILKCFPPKEVVLRDFTPRATKFGTINKTSVPRSLWDQIHTYTIGATYQQTKLVDFNPASHKQVLTVLNEAGWSPTDKTTTHVQTERELKLLQRDGRKDLELDAKKEMLSNKLLTLGIYGWRVNEQNLSTLPDDAPLPARTLARRILYESRRRTLTEWLGLASDDQRIHGSFSSIGTWTHRMAHQKPNTANIPNDKQLDGSTKLLGKELRSLWQAPEQRCLVGVDAEGIQLRVFAHYIDDKEFTDALVNGRKVDKTDPHSLNQRILGRVCKSRQAAKRFVYALLLGAGITKLSEVLECSETECREALNRLLKRYSGFARLKEQTIPKDALRGYFIGLDGRKVPILGDSTGERKHLAMSGYLQNGEAIIIKRAAVISAPQIERLDSFFVDIVHDEFQTEAPIERRIALQVAQIEADAIKAAGEYYNLKCPMAGSYHNDHDELTIGSNWCLTH